MATAQMFTEGEQVSLNYYGMPTYGFVKEVDAEGNRVKVTVKLSTGSTVKWLNPDELSKR